MTSTLKIEASARFSFGIISCLPEPDRAMAIGRTPGTALIFPSKASSPRITLLCSDSIGNCSVTASIPTAIGRSNPEPSFFTSAGARFTVILLMGKAKLLFLRAALTLSLASFTAASGNPTIVNDGKALPVMSTSTISGSALRPSKVTLSTDENTIVILFYECGSVKFDERFKRLPANIKLQTCVAD